MTSSTPTTVSHWSQTKHLLKTNEETNQNKICWVGIVQVLCSFVCYNCAGVHNLYKKISLAELMFVILTVLYYCENFNASQWIKLSDEWQLLEANGHWFSFYIFCKKKINTEREYIRNKRTYDAYVYNPWMVILNKYLKKGKQTYCVHKC